MALSTLAGPGDGVAELALRSLEILKLTGQWIARPDQHEDSFSGGAAVGQERRQGVSAEVGMQCQGIRHGEMALGISLGSAADIAPLDVADDQHPELFRKLAGGLVAPEPRSPKTLEEGDVGLYSRNKGCQARQHLTIKGQDPVRFGRPRSDFRRQGLDPGVQSDDHGSGARQDASAQLAGKVILHRWSKTNRSC